MPVVWSQPFFAFRLVTTKGRHVEHCVVDRRPAEAVGAVPFGGAAPARAGGGLRGGQEGLARVPRDLQAGGGHRRSRAPRSSLRRPLSRRWTHVMSSVTRAAESGPAGPPGWTCQSGPAGPARVDLDGRGRRVMGDSEITLSLRRTDRRAN
eukprot:1191809-Prorocentrum_minimum.AAC.3